jgi:dipeptidyl aminopeptidase/acylaminoacyl peptidase
MQTPVSAPFGSWTSPITADLIASGSVRLTNVEMDGDTLFWLESRPTEGGRYVLVRRGAGGQVEDVTPAGTNVRTRVQEYGGGSFLIAGDTVFFTDFANQRLHRQDKGDDPFPITPDPDVPAGLRFASMRLTPDGRTLVAIRERHADEGREADNELVTLAATGGDAQIIASGYDFFAAPAISPDGRQLAWITWDHPRMPWDGTELWLADLHGDGSVTNARAIAGGPQESIFQPSWSPDGALHFASDRTGWWNLYRWDGSQAVALAPYDAEFGQPQWSLDARSYVFLSDGRIACIVVENGIERLAIIEASGNLRWIDTPFTVFGDIASGGGDRLALIAAGPTQSGSVVLLDTRDGAYEIVKRSNDTEFDPGYISPAEPIEFPTTNGLTAHAFAYAPKNKDYAAPDGELPPLIVFSHGGPTGATAGGLNLSIQFWTSRGFAVVDVNYGGSTGYGRAYRERLKGTWGITDIDDCVNAARYLAEQGRADASRMAIRGGSAGGYTTLAALTFRDVFAAGASYYGVADLGALARDTHKFESRYLDGLVGPWPEAEAIYEARSPIFHTDQLATPMIIFQGLEDAVVPPAQAEMMVAALQAKGITYAYLPFEGEQHGFRRAENIKRSLEAELYFYAHIFGFEPADQIAPVEIVRPE